jgi:hypothetical protein
MIQSGFVELTSQGLPWPLSGGAGRREFVSPDVQFPQPFAFTPRMQVALSGLTTIGGDLILTIDAVNVQPEEFNIRVVVDGNTQMEHIRVTWFAHD